MPPKYLTYKQTVTFTYLTLEKDVENAFFLSLFDLNGENVNILLCSKV